MNVRKRSGMMGESGAPAPKNSVSTRKGGESQASAIRNAHNKPAKVGVSAVRNSVNGPST